MDSLRRRALGRSPLLWGWLWAALGMWLWVGAVAPLDGLSRLAAASHGAEGDAIVSADRGHAHDPAREPPAGAIDAAEAEEELGDDSEADHDAHAFVIRHTQPQRLARSGREQVACPRDPSVAQRHNRGPPRA